MTAAMTADPTAAMGPAAVSAGGIEVVRGPETARHVATVMRGPEAASPVVGQGQEGFSGQGCTDGRRGLAVSVGPGKFPRGTGSKAR